MKLRIALPFALLALLVLVGCETTEVNIAPDAVPEKVMSAFKKQHPDVTVIEVKKETYNDGIVHYEFEFAGKDGKKRDTEFNTDGVELDAH